MRHSHRRSGAPVGAGVVLGGLLLAGASAAEETGADGADWSFRVAPYLWLAGLSGEAATLPGAPPAEIDLSFGDILETLRFGAFVAAEARRGDLFLRADLQAVLTETDVDTPGPRFSGGTLSSDTYFLGLYAGGVVYADERVTAEVFAGARAWLLDTGLSLDAGLAGAASRARTETFASPVAGLSGQAALSADWTVFASGSVGGFGAGADLDASATGGLRYAAGETWGLVAGYRWLRIDYSDGAFLYDATQQGPFLGADFRF